jgi:hypothetical protein
MTSNLPFVSLCAIAVTGCSQFEGLRRAAGPWEFIWDPLVRTRRNTTRN